MILFSELEIVRLSLAGDLLTDFDCGDADLNGFLYENAIQHLDELLAVTYLVKNLKSNQIVAYYTVSNDKISSQLTPIKEVANNLDDAKRYNSYPALKIGRLAIAVSAQRQGIGVFLLNCIKYSFAINNKTGCRFLTVDAYCDALTFYEKAGFVYLTGQDKNRDTRQMMFDLSLVKNAYNN